MAKQSSISKRRVILTAIALVALMLLLGVFSYYAYQFKRFLQRPLITHEQGLHYIFKPGATITDLAAYLHKNAQLPKPGYLIWYARLRGESKRLQAGEYIFPAGMTPAQLLQQLVTGRVVQHRITIVNGWTFKKMMSIVDIAPMLKHELINKSPSQIAALFGIKRDNPEGLFFPATYDYTMGATDIELLKTAHRLLQRKLTTLWADRAKNLPYKTPYQALIVASMIEKETGVVNEKSLIASVIINRLRKKMYLQIDPTVIYGLDDHFNGKLTAADLRKKTAYNTYTNKGLPPTPIALPGEQAIHAALHPETTDLLYFVAKGDGSHYFSTTLKSHDKAIIKYQMGGGDQSNKQTCVPSIDAPLSLTAPWRRMFTPWLKPVPPENLLPMMGKSNRDTYVNMAMGRINL